MTISTPSPRITSRESPICGLATATITSANARNRNTETIGISRRRRGLLFPDTSRVSAYLMPTGPIRRFHKYGSPVRTSVAGSRRSSHGDAKLKPLTTSLSPGQVRYPPAAPPQTPAWSLPRNSVPSPQPRRPETPGAQNSRTLRGQLLGGTPRLAALCCDPGEERHIAAPISSVDMSIASIWPSSRR